MEKLKSTFVGIFIDEKLFIVDTVNIETGRVSLNDEENEWTFQKGRYARQRG